ncbi:MAG: HD domain-containing protein [Acidimicrobiales bacterium]
MAGFAHLARRFFGSLRPGGPSAADQAWVDDQLLPAERALFARMPGPDRRHAAGVAREVQRALGHEATRPVLAAALLHDVGKIESGLRTYGRVVATVSGKVAGPEMAHTWRKQRGYARRVGLYLLHADLGGDLLELAGSDPLTVAWAREHHLPEPEWTVPAPLGRVLKDADDD